MFECANYDLCFDDKVDNAMAKLRGMVNELKTLGYRCSLFFFRLFL